jgi:hypothetical protein
MKIITSVVYSINGKVITKEEAIEHVIKRQAQKKPA